jgi:hypothetical protein
LIAGQEISWSVVADVNQDHSQVATLRNLLAKDRSALAQQLEMDIAHGAQELNALVASADGGQLSAEPLTTAHHQRQRTLQHHARRHFCGQWLPDQQARLSSTSCRRAIAMCWQTRQLPSSPRCRSKCTIRRSVRTCRGQRFDPNLIRLCYEYLPLTFSRRHGDPSRPWNRFSINLTQPDGSQRLDYQGNWRDIFQNWEPLAWSFPVCRGHDRQIPERHHGRRLQPLPGDARGHRVGGARTRTTRGPTSATGATTRSSTCKSCWSSGRIRFTPASWQAQLWNQPSSATPTCPIAFKKATDALLADWYDTIDFDWERERAVGYGACVSWAQTANSLADDDGQVMHVTLAEKLLVLVLAKAWQPGARGRHLDEYAAPEWNDANNALVGKGLSVVTAAYLRRMIVFCRKLFTDEAQTVIILTSEVKRFFEAIYAVLEAHQPQLATGFTASQRRAVMDGLGSAASDYRWQVYRSGFCAEIESVTLAEVQALLALAQAYLDQTLRANRRTDGLFHTYNILRLGEVLLPSILCTKCWKGK